MAATGPDDAPGPDGTTGPDGTPGPDGSSEVGASAARRASAGAPAAEDVGGRRLAYDDVGDPLGWPVVFFHGTPDSRRARHPDDGLARVAGVRLLAIDRPGIGASDHDPHRSLGSFADDVTALLDRLAVDRCSVLAWSAGAVPALAFAARHPGSVAKVGVVGGLVPFAAYDDPAVYEAAGPARRGFVDVARQLDPDEVGRELAPMYVPVEAGPDGAAAHVRAGWAPVEEAEAAAVPGALEAMAAGLLDAVAGPSGTAGLERDIALQVAAPDVDLFVGGGARRAGRRLRRRHVPAGHGGVVRRPPARRHPGGGRRRRPPAGPHRLGAPPRPPGLTRRTRRAVPADLIGRRPRLCEPVAVGPAPARRLRPGRAGSGREG